MLDVPLNGPAPMLPGDGFPVPAGAMASPGRPEPFAMIGRRPVRHLPDRILVAAHEACDLGATEVAAALLAVLETVLSGMTLVSPTAQKRAMEGLVAAHGRLWQLRQNHRHGPGVTDEAPR